MVFLLLLTSGSCAGIIEVLYQGNTSSYVRFDYKVKKFNYLYHYENDRN